MRSLKITLGGGGDIHTVYVYLCECIYVYEGEGGDGNL